LMKKRKPVLKKRMESKEPGKGDRSLIFRIGLAQMNAVVGDIRGNLEKVLSYCREGERRGVDLVLFPELALTGYPPEDLLLKASFVKDNMVALHTLARGLKGMKLVAVVGFVALDKDIYNAAGVIQSGDVKAVYYKRYLPNYSVFDEDRYFKPGHRALILEWGRVRMAVTICEDLWYPESVDVGEVELILNLSSSPYYYQKSVARERVFGTRASDTQAMVGFCNMVGGQDELVFDGGSTIIGPRGDVIARAKFFEEDFLISDLDLKQVFSYRLHEPRMRKAKEEKSQDGKAEIVTLSDPPFEKARSRKPVLARIARSPDGAEELFQALVLGTRDYVRKNGFKKVLIGLSGGIDSSLVACIAVEALGKDSVVGVTMPSRYTSDATRRDAIRLAKNLGIKCFELRIEKTFKAYLESLKHVFKGLKPDVTEENLQARIRGNLLMALSNKFGWLVLTTGNKSEIATGYCTLYGDMAGGFAVIKDVPKTMVYKIAEYYNKLKAKNIIPVSVIQRAPSAELRPNQKDQDTLPPYEILDPILQGYIVEDMGYEDLIAKGHQPEIVKKVIKMVDRNEYKRRQAPPGIKITTRAFGRDWRLPITNHYNLKNHS